MFQRIRRSMTLLYTAVLAVTLLLAGTVLYVAVRHTVQVSILDVAQGYLDDTINHNLSLTGFAMRAWRRVASSPARSSARIATASSTPATTRMER